jgi:hypothetical protein
MKRDFVLRYETMENCEVIGRSDDPDQTLIITSENPVDLEEKQDSNRHERGR